MPMFLPISKYLRNHPISTCWGGLDLHLSADWSKLSILGSHAESTPGGNHSRTFHFEICPTTSKLTKKRGKTHTIFSTAIGQWPLTLCWICIQVFPPVPRPHEAHCTRNVASCVSLESFSQSHVPDSNYARSSGGYTSSDWSHQQRSKFSKLGRSLGPTVDWNHNQTPNVAR